MAEGPRALRRLTRDSRSRELIAPAAGIGRDIKILLIFSDQHIEKFKFPYLLVCQHIPVECMVDTVCQCRLV